MRAAPSTTPSPPWKRDICISRRRRAFMSRFASYTRRSVRLHQSQRAHYVFTIRSSENKKPGKKLPAEICGKWQSEEGRSALALLPEDLRNSKSTCCSPPSSIRTPERYGEPEKTLPTNLHTISMQMYENRIPNITCRIALLQTVQLAQTRGRSNVDLG